jgi:tRNA threonylcarbamoyladenosine biosynthesis protein TsaE
MKIVSRSASDTINVGEQLGRILCKGDVVCLDGDLGAGKTSFVSGVGKGLGIQDSISSPTFTIVNEYDTVLPLFHFDVYRVFDLDELFMIGFEEYFDDRGVVVIEWANQIEELLPKDYLKVKINLYETENSREILFESMGERSKEILKELQRSGNFENFSD